MPKKIVVGVVTSDKMKKTRRVEVSRLVKYPKYGKYVKRRTVCYVHDEENSSVVGDTVEIVESRPLSRLKRWKLVRIVTKGNLIDVAALRAAAKLAAATNQQQIENS
ncbi:MAG: 30S ribosomal protein S17 [Planctomycetaceae bacterium]|jgi:small subunit ribosomal protein S17|nr:30S ribosomal protein S17 [Planctomycetaceae bacterium]